MRWRTTLLLLLVVLALGAFIVLIERKGDATRQREEHARRAVQVDPLQISYLRIETTNGVIECAKENDEWMLMKPLRARASYAAIQRLLNGLADLPRGEVITPEQRAKRSLSYASYGLDHPRASITYGDALRRQTIQIGRDAPLGAHLYIRATSGDHIIATSTNLLALLPASPVVLRDRALIRIPPDRVQRLEVYAGAKFVQLVRQDAGQWLIQQPVVRRASSAAVLRWLDALYHLTAADFVTDAPADVAPYGLDTPTRKVTLWTGDKEPEITLLVGTSLRERAGLVYAKLLREPTVYAVSTNALPDLSVDVDAICDRRITTWQPREVASLELRSREGALKLERIGTEWRVTQPRAWKADTEKVEEVLDTWIGAVAVSFEDGVTNLAAFALDKPAWELVFARAPETRSSLTGSTQTLQISVAPLQDKDETVVARVEGEAPLFRLSNMVLNVLSADPLFFHDREIIRLGSNDIVGISVVMGERRQTLVRKEDGTFRPQGESQFVLNETALQTLLMVAQDLRAERLVAENVSDLSPYGLDKPTEHVTFELRSELGISKTVLFGAAAGPAEVYAMVRGHDLVFTLNAATKSALVTDLYHVPSP